MSKQGNHLKVRCERRGNQVFVRCPRCNRSQEIIQSRDWYTIEPSGVISPIFVCAELHCEYEGYLQITN